MQLACRFFGFFLLAWFVFSPLNAVASDEITGNTGITVQAPFQYSRDSANQTLSLYVDVPYLVARGDTRAIEKLPFHFDNVGYQPTPTTPDSYDKLEIWRNYAFSAQSEVLGQAVELVGIVYETETRSADGQLVETVIDDVKFQISYIENSNGTAQLVELVNSPIIQNALRWNGHTVEVALTPLPYLYESSGLNPDGWGWSHPTPYLRLQFTLPVIVSHDAGFQVQGIILDVPEFELPVREHGSYEEVGPRGRWAEYNFSLDDLVAAENVDCALTGKISWDVGYFLSLPLREYRESFTADVILNPHQERYGTLLLIINPDDATRVYTGRRYR